VCCQRDGVIPRPSALTDYPQTRSVTFAQASRKDTIAEIAEPDTLRPCFKPARGKRSDSDDLLFLDP